MIPSDARFLRDNRDPGQIVGGTAVGVGALRDQTGQAGQMMQGFQRTQPGFNVGGFNARGFNQFGNMGQMGQFGRAFGGAMNTRGARTRETLRTSVELGFQAPVAPTPTAVSSRVQNRIARIPRIQEMGSVNVQMEGQTAVLQGQVASAQDRDLVARMLLLEPGISDVRNELTLSTSNDPAAQP
ncbi:MAG: BON domain-containing protein [Planctomycetaceae bacterium]|nr:MAG: BON domain-containing protein [Planctomycetaceae bacterium]